MKIPKAVKQFERERGLYLAQVEPGKAYGLWQGRPLMPLMIRWFSKSGLYLGENYSDAAAPYNAAWAVLYEYVVPKSDFLFVKRETARGLLRHPNRKDKIRLIRKSK